MMFSYECLYGLTLLLELFQDLISNGFHRFKYFAVQREFHIEAHTSITDILQFQFA